MVDRVFPPVPDLANAEFSSLSQVFSRGLTGEENGTDHNHLFKELFTEGRELDQHQVLKAIFPLKIESLLKFGLLEEVQGHFRASMQIQLYHGLIFLSDFFRWENNPNFVLPIGPAGRYLADLTIRRPTNSTLDMGCGCGIQSLLAAQHSVKVTATDINPRAVALTRINALLNGISNIEVLEGSHFEPVRGRKFDLIVANLPYVITPESHFIYRDVDQPGDGSLRKWLQEIPLHLEEGGFTHMLINWIIRKDQSWVQPVQDYVKSFPLDSWLIYSGSKTPNEYAEIWIDTETKKDAELYESTRRDWLAWYEGQSIQQIGLGSLTLRRRSATKNWFRAIPVKVVLKGQAGEQFVRLYAAQDYLDTFENKQDLLRILLRKVNLEIVPDAEQINTVFCSDGMHIQVTLNPATMVVLNYLDGQTMLEKILEKLLSDGLVTTLFTQEVLNDVEMLIQLGMLVPIEY